jgi:hypothetical protein
MDTTRFLAGNNESGVKISLDVPHLNTNPSFPTTYQSSMSESLGSIPTRTDSPKELSPSALNNTSSLEIWSQIGPGKPLPPRLLDPEAYLVEFDGASDPLHPQNWSFQTKSASSLFR